jgi:hypothetical protein
MQRLEKIHDFPQFKFDHPYLKEPCFILGLEQKEFLKSCEVFKSFQNQNPIPNSQ